MPQVDEASVAFAFGSLTGLFSWRQVMPSCQLEMETCKKMKPIHLTYCGIMNVKNTWTDDDFDDMGWHDNQIYAFSIPKEDLTFTLDIDYIFQWDLHPTTNFFNFWVSPCTLRFERVLQLKIDLTFENRVGLYVEDILRKNPRPSQSGTVTIWEYEIRTDCGTIAFESSGYLQLVHQQPVLSEGQSLDLAARPWWPA